MLLLRKHNVKLCEYVQVPLYYRHLNRPEVMPSVTNKVLPLMIMVIVVVVVGWVVSAVVEAERPFPSPPASIRTF